MRLLVGAASGPDGCPPDVPARAIQRQDRRATGGPAPRTPRDIWAGRSGTRAVRERAAVGRTRCQVCPSGFRLKATLFNGSQGRSLPATLSSSQESAREDEPTPDDGPATDRDHRTSCALLFQLRAHAVRPAPLRGATPLVTASARRLCRTGGGDSARVTRLVRRPTQPVKRTDQRRGALKKPHPPCPARSCSAAGRDPNLRPRVSRSRRCGRRRSPRWPRRRSRRRSSVRDPRG